MNERNKLVIDWLTLPVLGLPAAVLWIDYINNTHPSKLWIVLLLFDITFVAAALVSVSFQNGKERSASSIEYLYCYALLSFLSRGSLFIRNRD
jgi:hypothetical protein